MTYTYDNILEEARKAGVLEKFSQEDHTAAQKNPEYGMSLVGLLKDANNATTETQRLLAMETMNNLRKSYGVTGATGGTTGSFFAGAQRLVAPEKTGTLSGNDPTTYQAVLDDIVNQKEFAYDPEQDPIYQSYERTYRREGDRASENALAKAAAMTGGRPSSYAISAAQQAGNQYAAALADMIPTLRQNAYTEHQNELAAKYDILSVLGAEKEAQAAEKAKQYNNLIEMASSGYVPTDAQLKNVGMTREMANALNAAYVESIRKNMDSDTYDTFVAEVDGALSIQDMVNIMEKWKAAGFTEDQISNMPVYSQKYADLFNSGKLVRPGDGRKMADLGILSVLQWREKRAEYEKGNKDSWEGQFSTYLEYVKAYGDQRRMDLK